MYSLHFTALSSYIQPKPTSQQNWRRKKLSNKSVDEPGTLTKKIWYHFPKSSLEVQVVRVEIGAASAPIRWRTQTRLVPRQRYPAQKRPRPRRPKLLSYSP